MVLKTKITGLAKGRYLTYSRSTSFITTPVKQTTNSKKKFFSESVRDFEKFFPDEEKILEYDDQKEIVKSFREEYDKNVELFEKTKHNLKEENEKKKCSRKRTYFTTNLTC